jgi:hypothetical protein
VRLPADQNSLAGSGILHGLLTGEAAIAGDIAKAEKVTDQFVSRAMRLACLSPEVLDRLVVEREPAVIFVTELRMRPACHGHDRQQ